MNKIKIMSTHIHYTFSMGRTIMLTGDAQETALGVSRQVGLLTHESSERGLCVSGGDLDRLSDADLGTVVRSASVFYRVTPRHKVRIVKALQV